MSCSVLNAARTHAPFFFYFQATAHLRLAQQTLKTLTGYLDWVKFAVLYSENCVILQMLCLLLEEDPLKILAAECLLMIVRRKVNISCHSQLYIFSAPRGRMNRILQMKIQDGGWQDEHCSK